MTSPLPPALSGALRDCSVDGATQYTTGDVTIDSLQKHFRPVLEANYKMFQGRTGTVQGFGAGTIYPQLWLRDGATLVPATRYFYPRPVLASWLEEHLAHQRENGELWDWIAAGPSSGFAATAPRAVDVFTSGSVTLSADKNTTASDQESSAVDAAWTVFSLGGDRTWLTKEVAGRSVVDRLDAALSFVRRERFDEDRGLVTTAFTADWGDVSSAHADQNAIYLDDRTDVVAGLYASVLFAHAAEEMASLHSAVGADDRALTWREVASTVRAGVNRHLWQESRGFYAVHRLLIARGTAGGFDDSDIFALGGNALAVLYGVADDHQASRIFEVAEARRQQAGLSSVAGVLLPPYPTGFFPHPILRTAFTYQNGGQWDWWSGRLLLAMFRRGQSSAAQAQLLQIARRVRSAGGLYEWYTPGDVGQGSQRFAGSAGALAGAIYLGLYGFDSRSDGLDITVRLGSVSGRARVCEAALDRRLSYDYRYEPNDRRLRFQFDGDAPGTGRLALRIPSEREPSLVLRDGRSVPFELSVIGADRYVSLMTEWVPHQVEVQLNP